MSEKNADHLAKQLNALFGVQDDSPLGWTAIFIGGGAAASLVWLIQRTNQKGAKPLQPWVWPAVIAAIAMLVIGAFLVWWRARRVRLQEAAREREVLESAAERLREKMELPSLINFNRVLLDRYHGIATEQATKAYRSSRFAMGVGLVILVVAFAAGWRLNAQGDRLFVGTVAMVGSAFTAYLSRTYMQTYERALQQLNEYFNQPVLNGYFLTAERIADSLPEDRRVAMLEQVLADVLESGKEMHRGSLAASAAQVGATKPGRLRRTAQAGAQVPAQQSQ
ncbi:hypothetical protein [Streptomyces sp. NPDC001851]|uniref:hypothetical protein n=1 Tax=Streptomyces sp. NPDC001851 TaxID=3154529 RepID=UPI00332B4FF0